MPFFKTYQNRRTLEHVAAKLEDGLANDMANGHTRRFGESPPPFTSSLESKRPNSPTVQLDKVDEVEFIRMRVLSRNKGMPRSMFELQTWREEERLIHQISNSSSGRRSTLHFDKNLDLTANAENNVRHYWLQDGIWDDDWGCAWSSKSCPSDYRRNQVDDPSPPKPYGCWKHERPIVPASSRLSTAADDVSRETEDISGLKATADEALRQAESSRPYRQFMSQVLRERRWIQDELAWKGHGGDNEEELGNAALHAVRKFWQENDLWQTEWDLYPGRSWAHELPDDDLERHPRYHQLYSMPSALTAEAGKANHEPQACRRPALPDTAFGVFGGGTAPHRTEKATRPTTSRRLRTGQQSSGLRRSQRLIDRENREKKTSQRSSRLKQQEVTKLPPRRKRRRS